MNTATAENYLFEDMPQAAEPTTALEQFKADIVKYQQFCREHDGAIYPQQAAVALGVSNQCILDLLERDRLSHIVVFGRKVISCRDVLTRMESRPVAGRPRGAKGAARLGLEMAKAAFKK